MGLSEGLEVAWPAETVLGSRLRRENSSREWRRKV